MGVGDFFRKINSFLEDKYSSLLDFLEDKGLPAYKYNDWLEMHGIPAMWFSIFIVLFIIIAIILVSFLVFHTTISLSINVYDMEGNLLSDPIFLKLTSGEDIVFSQSISSGESYVLDNVKKGEELSVEINSEKYVLVSPDFIIVEGSEINLNLTLKEKEENGIVRLKLLDEETKTPVVGASVYLIADGAVISSGKSNSEGEVEFSNAPINKNVSVKVEKDGYATFDSELSFAYNDTQEINLAASEVDNGNTATLRFEVKSIDGPIKDAVVKIYYSDSKEQVDEVKTDEEGVALFEVKTGSVIRYVVSKKDLLTFDSNTTNKNITVRSDEKIPVFLKPGGTDLKVIVNDTSGITLSSAKVALFTKDGLIIDSNITNNFGIVYFNGVDVRKAYYVGVYFEGMYPETKKVNLDETNEIEITLSEMSPVNTATIDITTVDSANNPVPNAKLSFYILDENSLLPLYLGNIHTGPTGYYLQKLKTGNKIKIKAYGNKLEGELTLDLNKGRNFAKIVMAPSEGIVRFNIYDAFNNPLVGAEVVVKTKNGEYLFDGKVNEDGYIEGYAEGNTELILEITDKEGNLFSKIVKVEKIVDVKVSKEDILDVPKISFIGIFDGKNQVQGVQPGKEYWFKFKVSWPNELGSGLVHIRLGDDGVAFNQQDYGIVLADAPSVAKYTYGLTYTSKPLPGNFLKDTKVLGRPGLNNKWVNLLWNMPVGSVEIKVKVKVLKDANIKEIPLHYRAEMILGKDEKSLRDPEDKVLGNNITSNKKHHLYASTYDKKINVMPDMMLCSESMCVSYKIIDDVVAYDHFLPVVGNVYALDMEFLGLKEGIYNVSFSTNKVTKKAYLNNIDFDPKEFVPRDEKHYDLVQKGIALAKDERKKIRVYFTTVAVGNSFVSFEITGDAHLKKSFDFTIYDKKQMQISMTNNGIVNVGEDIYITVKDDKKPITNAYISVLDDKSTSAFFTKGNNTNNNGKDGVYLISGLPSGIYTLKVSAPGYAANNISFVVTRIGILETKPEFEIRIPKEKKSMVGKLLVKNNSKFNIQKLRYKIIRADADNFDYKITFSKTYILGNNYTYLVFNVKPTVDEEVFGDLELMISGELATKEIVRTIVHIKLVNGKDYDDNCLVIVPAELKLDLPDFPNASKEIDFILENKCEFDIISSQPELISRDGEDKKIEFYMKSFKLKRGEKKKITAKFTNKIARNSEGLIADFFINVKTPYFLKQIPITIDIWKTATALQMQVPSVVFLYSNRPSVVGLILKNAGNLPVKNVELLTQKSQKYLLGMVPEHSNVGSTFDPRYLNYLNNMPFQQAGYVRPPVRQNYSAETNTINIFYPYLYFVNNTSVGVNNIGLGQYMGGSVSFGNADIFYNPSKIDELKPGQSYYVKMTVLSKTQKTSYSTPFTVLARGFIEGAKQRLQTYGITYVVGSGEGCLKIVNNNKSFAFRSAKTDNKVIPLKMKVINKCSEPMLVQNISVNNIGGIPLFLEPVSSNIVMPNSKAEFILKSKAVKEAETGPRPVYLLARAVSSNQQIIVPFMVELSYGASAITDLGSAPIKTTKKLYCDSKDSITMALPKISDKGDCSSSYCDGEAASNYILTMAKNYYSSYKSKLSKIGRKNATYGCTTSGACNFEDIGVDSPEFVVYLMNDVISEKYLNKNLSAYLKGIKIATIYNGDFDIVQSTANLATKKLFVPRMNKCGKYTLKLEGASLIFSDVLQPESYNLKVKIVDYETTDECKPNILNAAIFLPKDKKTGVDNAYGFKPGYIDFRDNELKVLAEELSKNYLGVERVKEMEYVDNVLYLKRGTTKDNAPVEFRILSKDGVVTLEATINKDLPIGAASVRKSIVNTIIGYLQGNFRGCITKDLMYARVISSEKPKKGEFAIKGCDVLRIYKGSPSCKFKVYTGSLIGSAKIDVYVPDALPVSAKILDKGKEVLDEVLFKHNKSAGTMEKDLTLVVDVDKVADSIRYGKDNPLVLVVKDDAGNTLAEKEVKFEGCGISYETFNKKTLDNWKKLGSYSAILNWQHAGDTKSICESFEEMNDYGGENYILSSKDCTGLVSEKKAIGILSDKLMPGIGLASVGAFTGCMVAELGASVLSTKMIFKLLLGPVSGAAAVFDCAITTSMMASTSLYQLHRWKVKSGISETGWYDSLHDTLAKTPVFNILFNDYDKVEPKEALGLHNYEINPFEDNTNVVLRDYLVTGATVGAVRGTGSVIDKVAAEKAAMKYISLYNSGAKEEELLVAKAELDEAAKKIGLKGEDLIKSGALKNVAEEASEEAAESAVKTNVNKALAEATEEYEKILLNSRDIAKTEYLLKTLSKDDLSKFVVKIEQSGDTYKIIFGPRNRVNINQLKDSVLRKVPLAEKLFPDAFNQVSPNKKLVSFTVDSVSDIEQLFPKILEKGSIVEKGGKEVIKGRIFNLRKGVVLSDAINKPDDLIKQLFFKRKEQADLLVDLKKKIPSDSLSGRKLLSQIEGTKSMLVKDDVKKVVENFAEKKPVAELSAFKKGLGIKTGSETAIEKTVENAAKDAVKRGAWNRISTFFKGMATGIVGAEAGVLAYKEAFNLFASQIKYDVPIINIALNNVTNYVKYEDYTMEYSRDGRKDFVLTVESGFTGTNLSNNCDVRPEDLIDTENIQKGQTNQTKEIIINKIKTIDAIAGKYAYTNWDIFNKAYSKASTNVPKELFAALVFAESSFKFQNNVSGAQFGSGFMQMTEIGCKESKKLTRISVNDCLGKKEQNLISGMALYSNYRNQVKNYLRSKGIEDNDAIDFFTVFAYNRGLSTAKQAIELWLTNKDVSSSLKEACIVWYSKTKNTKSKDFFCGNVDEFPKKVLGIYLYLTGRVDSVSKGKAYIVSHLNSLVKIK